MRRAKSEERWRVEELIQVRRKVGRCGPVTGQGGGEVGGGPANRDILPRCAAGSMGCGGLMVRLASRQGECGHWGVRGSGGRVSDFGCQVSGVEW